MEGGRPLASAGPVFQGNRWTPAWVNRVTQGVLTAPMPHTDLDPAGVGRGVAWGAQ